jgi:hypothetical protein
MTEVSKIKGHRHPRFQGVREAGARLRPSAEGLRRLRERAHQLYEREGDWQRLRQYVLRWQRWGDRTYKLGSGTTSEPGRYVKSLGEPRGGIW